MNYSKIYHFISEAHLVISFAAYCQAQLVRNFFSFKDENNVALFVGLTTFIVYNFYSVFTAYFHPENFEKHRIHFWQDNRRYYLFLLLIVSGVTLFKFYFLLPIFLSFSFHHFVAFFILGTASILYGVPFYKNKSLRDLPFIKIFIISFVWAAMIVSFQLLANGNQFSAISFKPSAFSYLLSNYFGLIADSLKLKAIFLFIEKFCFIFALTLLCDIKDADWDKQGGVKTIPNFFGLEKTKRLIYLLLFFISCLDFYLFNSKLLITSLIVLGFTFFVTKNTKINSSTIFYKDGVDALLIFQWFFV